MMLALVVSLPPGVKPKKFKSRHKTPVATVSTNPTVVVPTGLVAHEPQDQGGVEGLKVVMVLQRVRHNPRV